MTDAAERLERNRRVWDAYDELFCSMRFEEWAQLWTEDGRFVVRNPTPGGLEVLEGRQAIYENFVGFRGTLDSVEFRDRTFEPTADPDVVWVQYHIHADVPNGDEFDNSAAARLQFRDGLLAELQIFGYPRVRRPDGSLVGAAAG